MRETCLLPQMRVNRVWCGQRLQGRRLARASDLVARNDKRHTHTSSNALVGHERPLCGVDGMTDRHSVVDFPGLCPPTTPCICDLAKA